MKKPKNPPPFPSVINGESKPSIVAMHSSQDFICVVFDTGDLYVVTADGRAKKVNFDHT